MPLDKRDHLLMLLAEECAEIQQLVSKCLRFGVDDHYNGQTNREMLIHEFNDLLAVVDHLRGVDIHLLRNEKLIDQKKEKLAHYMQVSRECGKLDDHH